MLVNGLLELTATQRQVSSVLFWVSESYCPSSLSTHSLDAFFVDTDAPEQGFKDFAEGEGEEAHCAELQAVSHLLQDGGRLPLHFICTHARFLGDLDDSKYNDLK